MPEAIFDAPSQKVISPAKLAHVVLRTGNFEKMVEFWKTFLGAEATYENDFLSFLTYDEEHHRIAVVAIPDTGPKIPSSSGLGAEQSRSLFQYRPNLTM